MAVIVADRVRDTSTTTGAGGVFTVSGTAPLTYKTFSAVCAVSDTCTITIQHQSANEWMVADATYSAANQLTVLAQNVLSGSSGAGVLVNFSAGTKDIILSVEARNASARQILRANTTFYVSTGGNDTTGTGAIGNPWLTLQKAVNYISQNIDFGLCDCTVQLIAGTVGSPAVYAGVVIPPFAGNGSFLLETSDGNILTTKISSTTADAIMVGETGAGPQRVRIGGMWIESTFGRCLTALGNCEVELGTTSCPNLKFGQTGNDYIMSCQDHATVHAASTCNITLEPANCNGFVFASNAATVTIGSGTHTINGNPNWAVACLVADGGGIILVTLTVGTNVTGASTGKRYALTNGAFLLSGGALSSLPGDANGTAVNSIVDAVATTGYFQTVVLGNPTTANNTTIQSGVPTTSATYTLPTALGTSAGAALFDAAGNGVLSWNNNLGLGTITYVIDGGGSVITTGMKGYLEVPFACTILAATMLADVAGAAVVDVWKCTYAQFDAGATHPVVGDSITAGTPPTITATNSKAQDTTLASWLVTTNAGSILGFNVNSCTTITRLTLSLKMRKT